MRPVMPRFSPDGQYIAFSAKSNGHQDVYVMPAEALLVDRAQLLTLSAPEMTVLVGGRGSDRCEAARSWC
jgi:catalase (peroxidase I)